MEVATEDPAATVDSEGTRYYFCSTSCRDGFLDRIQAAGTDTHRPESSNEAHAVTDGLIEGGGTALDPVCGMTVDRTTAEHHSVNQDTTIYFCSAGCKESFEKDPGRYLASAEAPRAS